MQADMSSLVVETTVIVVLAVWWLAMFPDFAASQKRSFMSWWCSEGLELKYRIQAQMERKREQRLRSIVRNGLYAVPLLTIYSFSQALQDSMTSNRGILVNSRVGLNFEGLAISLLNLFSKSFPVHAERFISLQILDAFMMLLFLAVGLHTVYAFGFGVGVRHAEMFYVGSLNQAVTVQMLLATCMASPGKVGFVNLINVGIQFVLLYAVHFDVGPTGTYGKAGDGETASVCFQREDNLKWRLIWNAVMTQITASLVAEVLWAEAVASVGELEASRSEKTAAGLLSVMCDCVVSLRSDFSFREACPRFAALLLRENARTETKGSFCRYLTEAEQQRFKHFLTKGNDQAGTFHIDLVSAMSQKVAVQVFHTSWIDADDEVNYLLGIQEEKEVDSFPAPPGALQIQAKELPACTRERDEASGLFSDADSESSHARTHRSSSTGSLTRWGGSPLLCRVKVGVSLDLVEQSEECGAMLGLSYHSNDLLSRLPRDEAEWVLDWLRNLHMRNVKVAHGGHARKETFGEVSVLSAAGISYKVVLSARYTEIPVEEDLQHLISGLELVFTPMKVQKPTTGMDLLKEQRKRHKARRKTLEARAMAATSNRTPTPDSSGSTKHCSL